MNLKRILLYFRLHTKLFFRTRSGPFFLIIFPVILMLLFGSIFGSGGIGKTSIAVQNDGPDSPYIQGSLAAFNASGLFSVSLVPAGENITSYMKANSIDIGVVFPANFSSSISNRSAVVQYYSEPGDQTASTLQPVILNLILTGTGSTTATVYTQEVSVSGLGKAVDYYIPALLGYTIINGIFSMVYEVPNYRKDRIFRQLSFANLSKPEWLAATTLFYAVTTLISDVIIFGIGVTVFNVSLQVSIPGILLSIVVILSGLLLFTAIGLLAGLYTKDEESASLVANTIFFPMLFLSGVFYPISVLPSYLQTVAYVLPLTYFNLALKDILLYNAFSQVLLEILFMVLAGIGLFTFSSFLATRKQDE